MRSRSVGLVLLMLLVGGCGHADQPATRSTTNDSPLLTCAGPPFPASVFDAPASAERADSPQAAALRTAIVGPPFDPAHPLTNWRRLGQTDDEVAFGTGDPPILDAYVLLERRDGHWSYAGSGAGCVVRPYRPDRTLARWGLDPAGPPVDAATTSLHLIVNDFPCAGDVGADARLEDPDVDITADAVTITFTSRPPDGAQTCPSHPAANRVVQLPQPLGNRDLRDGGIFPAQPPCRIELNDCEIPLPERPQE